MVEIVGTEVDAENFTWEIDQGGDFTYDLEFYVTDEDGVTSERDMTGMTVEAQIRKLEKLDAALLYPAVSGFITFAWTNQATGKGTLTIPWADTIDFTFKKGFYDVFVKATDDSSRDKLFEGKVVVDRSVTANG